MYNRFRQFGQIVHFWFNIYKLWISTLFTCGIRLLFVENTRFMTKCYIDMWHIYFGSTLFWGLFVYKSTLKTIKTQKNQTMSPGWRNRDFHMLVIQFRFENDLEVGVRGFPRLIWAFWTQWRNWFDIWSFSPKDIKNHSSYGRNWIS